MCNIVALSKMWGAQTCRQWEFLWGQSTDTGGPCLIPLATFKHGEMPKSSMMASKQRMAVVHLAGSVCLFVQGCCSSAPLSGHQRSPPPAGQGSQGSDLHLCEVQGCQVALPRFPVHSLTEERGRKLWGRTGEGEGEEKETEARGETDRQNDKY